MRSWVSGVAASCAVVIVLMAAAPCFAQYPPPAALQPRPDVSALVARGASLARAGMLEDAIKDLRQALQIDPTSRDARYNLALAYYNASRFKDAIVHFKLVLGPEPNAVDALKGLGFSYHNLKQFSAAAPVLEKISQLMPGDAPTLTTLGRTYLALKQPARAAKALRLAVQAQPGDAGLLFELGKAEMSAGSFPGARMALQQALTLRPESVDTAVALGRTLLALNDPATAVQVLRPFALGITASREVLTYLAMGYDGIGDEDNALRVRAQLAQLLPPKEAAALRVKIGYSYLQRQMWPAALEQFRAASAVDPTSATAEAGQGQAYGGLEMRAPSVSHWRRASQLDAKSASIFLGLSGALLAAFDFRGAEAAARQALSLEPGSVLALRGAAEAATAAGDLLGAESYLRRVLARDPSDPAARAAVVDCLEQRGELLQALLEANELLASPKATAADYRRVAGLAESLGNLDLAVTVWRRLMNLGGKDQIDAATEAARVLTLAGRAGEAAETCRRLLVARPASPELQLALARAQLDSGQEAAAAPVLLGYLKRQPHDAVARAALAEALAGSGQPDPAWDTLQAAVAGDEVEAAVCRSVMGVGLRTGQVDRALGILEGLLPATAPQDLLLELITRGYRMLGRPADGGGVLAHLYEVEPGQSAIGLAAAHLLQEGRQPEAASRLVVQLLKDPSPSGGIQRRVVDLYLDGPFPVLALGPLRFMLEPDLASAGIVALLSELQARPDLVAQSAPLLRAMATAGPATPGFWLPAADLVDLMGRSTQELARLEAMSSAKPDDLALATGAAALALKTGRPQMADRILRAANASLSADPSALRVQARTLAAMDQLEAALSLSQRVLATSSATATDYLDRATWLLQAGRSDDAVTELGFALRTDPDDATARSWFSQLAADKTVPAQSLFDALQNVHYHHPESRVVRELMDQLAARDDAREMCQQWLTLTLAAEAAR